MKPIITGNPRVMHGEPCIAGGAKAADPGGGPAPELYGQIGRLKVEFGWGEKSRGVRLTACDR